MKRGPGIGQRDTRAGSGSAGLTLGRHPDGRSRRRVDECSAEVVHKGFEAFQGVAPRAQHGDEQIELRDVLVVRDALVRGTEEASNSRSASFSSSPFFLPDQPASVTVTTSCSSGKLRFSRSSTFSSKRILTRKRRRGP